MKALSGFVFAAGLCVASAAEAQINIPIPSGLPGNLDSAVRAVARIRIAPPSLQQESPPPAPGPHFFWVGGNWNWQRNQYQWVPGHWEADRPEQTWVPARWIQRAGEWVLQRGRWSRGSDEQGFYCNQQPPAPLVESPAPDPSGLHLWVSGHWGWQQDQYQWVPGHWENRRQGYAWAPDHWSQEGPRWHYLPGHWIRQ
jgi:hypothetical protein